MATTRSERGLAFYAHLYYKVPLRRLRIDAPDFDFSGLGERMLYQAHGNPKLLIQHVVDSAPEAWTGHGTRVLLEGLPIRPMGYAFVEDVEREARWLLTLRALGR